MVIVGRPISLSGASFEIRDLPNQCFYTFFVVIGMDLVNATPQRLARRFVVPLRKDGANPCRIVPKTFTSHSASFSLHLAAADHQQYFWSGGQ